MPSRVSHLPHTSFAWETETETTATQAMYRRFILRALACLSFDTETWAEAGKSFPPSCRVLAPSTLARQDLLPLKNIRND